MNALGVQVNESMGIIPIAHIPQAYKISPKLRESLIMTRAEMIVDTNASPSSSSSPSGDAPAAAPGPHAADGQQAAGDGGGEGQAIAAGQIEEAPADPGAGGGSEGTPR